MRNNNYHNLDRTMAPGHQGEGASSVIFSISEARDAEDFINPDVMEAEAGEIIFAGNAVYIKNGFAYNQTVDIIAETDYYTTFGIALNNALPNETFLIQYRGLIELASEINGNQLVVTNNQNNISDDVETAWKNYDRVIILGDLINENTLNINIQEFINN